MITFGASSYAILSALYALLALMLLTSWRGQRVGGYLVLACVVSAGWSGIHAYQVAYGTFSSTSMMIVEVVRAAAWFTFLSYAGLSRNIRILAHLTWISVLGGGCWIWISNKFLGTAGDIDTVVIPGGLAIALVGLVVVEQLYRNAPALLRSSIKTLALGLGGMFAYDLFLYSQGVLFSSIDTATWVSRGAVNILVVPLIALAARRNPNWDLNIFVSRQMVFYSTSLVAVGLYLLLMSLGGYLILIYGGEWGGIARVVFLAGAVLVLFTLLFSSTLRSRLKVFLSKHFFQNKYDYREEWLRLVATLSEFEDSSTRQVVIKAMAQIVDSPAGILWTRNSDNAVFSTAAVYGSDEVALDVSLDDSLVIFIEKDGWIVDLREYAESPDNYDGLVLPEWIKAIEGAWLIVPLMSAGELLGMVVLYEASAIPDLNYEDRDLLKTVGNHIAVHLAQEDSDRLLAQAQQFDAYNRLTAFLMHDLKNLIAQQSLIVENADKHKRNPEFIDDVIDTISGSVTRMRKVIEHLRHTSIVQKVEKVELSKIVMQVVSECESRKPVPRAVIGERQIWTMADRDRLFMALTHAVKNAQDATPDDGSVSIGLEESDGLAQVRIIDSGSGMTEEFVRTRLFKPFDSTKGTQGVGIGAFQIKETAKSLGGEVLVQSNPEIGTEITISLKAANREV